MDQSAPINHVDKLMMPTMIIQGKNDARVPYSEAEDLVREMTKRGAPVWYLLARNEGHNFTSQANIEFRLCAVVMFVKKYLLI